MLSHVKQGIREAIRSIGFDVHRLADGSGFGGHALELDLPYFVKDESPVIVDVGGNRGQRIELVRYAFSHPQVTSFEPNPNLAKFLRSKYAGFATIIEAAVGSAEGEMDFHIYANDRLSSFRNLEEGMAHLSYGDTLPRVTTKVPIVTLDSYWGAHGNTHIDILFIDAQGYDREVLRGAERLLESGGVETLVTDVYCANYYKGQDNYLWDVQPWLRQKGYGLIGLYEIIRDGPFISAAAGCFRKMPSQDPALRSGASAVQDSASLGGSSLVAERQLPSCRREFDSHNPLQSFHLAESIVTTARELAEKGQMLADDYHRLYGGGEYAESGNVHGSPPFV